MIARTASPACAPCNFAGRSASSCSVIALIARNYLASGSQPIRAAPTKPTTYLRPRSFSVDRARFASPERRAQLAFKDFPGAGQRQHVVADIDAARAFVGRDALAAEGDDVA